MSRWLQTLGARIDALALRERVLMFVSIIVLSIAAADAWLISPAQAEQKRISVILKRSDAELDTLRAQLTANTQSQRQPKDADPRVEIDGLRAQLEQVNRDVKSASLGSERAGALAEVLTHFLRQHEGLTLIRTSTLPLEVAATKTPATSASAPSPVVRRQGVELVVAGPYPELVGYVKTLEQALPRLRWGGMKLATDSMPPELTLQVFYVEAPP